MDTNQTSLMEVSTRASGRNRHSSGQSPRSCKSTSGEELMALLGPAPKKPNPNHLFETIDLALVEQAAKKAFEGHNSKSDVKAFKANFQTRIERIYNAIKDGTYINLIGYRKLVKYNHKRKRRLIDSPNLDTRIMQHLWLILIVPIYESKDNGNGMNCKPDHGITSDVKRFSTLHNQKHLYYDLREFNYLLLMDQRKCYEHITPKIYRKQIKHFTHDKAFIDFGEKIGFINNKLPIGTPTSPYIHHICLWVSDVFIRDNTDWSERYADDNAMAFKTIEDLNAFKWRLKNLWWYCLHLRAKRQMTRVLEINKCPFDFCGYVAHRNPGKLVAEHNKGFVKMREKTLLRAKLKCRQANTSAEKVNRSWSSYFGQMQHADAFREMESIEKSNMKLRALTDEIRIDREIDAPTVDIKDLLGKKFNLYRYRIKEYKGKPNWLQCLIGSSEQLPLKDVPERNKKKKKDTTRPTKKLKKLKDSEDDVEYAYEFHGDYQGLIAYLQKLEDQHSDDPQWFMPIEEAEVVKDGEWVFKGSTNKIKYINKKKYYG